MKNLIIFGTRPEAIKMAPVIKELKSIPHFETRVCVTAQHREMLDQVLDFFEIIPDYDLNLMKPGQDLFGLTATIISSLKDVLLEYRPDYIYVHGDTTTTMGASIAGFYAGAKVCHVEAGLRTYNKQAPFPEEINRTITGHIADFHFAPTEVSKANLLNEGVSDSNILVTGNTVIDALMYSLEKVNREKEKYVSQWKDQLDLSKEIILVTGHRRENHGSGFINICTALKEIALAKPEHSIVYPVHLNPKVQQPVYEILGDIPNIQLIEPMDYPSFVWLMSVSKLIITDSGGVQEEAPSLGKPVLVMRDTTERPEAVKAGTVILTGANKEKIVTETLSLLNDPSRYERMSKLHNPYGDGQAAKRISQFMNLKNPLD